MKTMKVVHISTDTFFQLLTANTLYSLDNIITAGILCFVCHFPCTYHDVTWGNLGR